MSATKPQITPNDDTSEPHPTFSVPHRLNLIHLVEIVLLIALELGVYLRLNYFTFPTAPGPRGQASWLGAMYLLVPLFMSPILVVQAVAIYLELNIVKSDERLGFGRCFLLMSGTLLICRFVLGLARQLLYQWVFRIPDSVFQFDRYLLDQVLYSWTMFQVPILAIVSLLVLKLTLRGQPARPHFREWLGRGLCVLLIIWDVVFEVIGPLFW